MGAAETPVARVAKTIELHGHLFDSLTLSKVIDTIQKLGGEFRINALRMGKRKSDLSFASIKVFAGETLALEKILEELAPYGARLAGTEEAILATCPAEGRIPENALKLYVPKYVCHEGEKLPVESMEGDWVVVIENDGGKRRPRLKKAGALKAGEQVVINYQGVIW